jgi:hypothetical protein
MVAVVLKTAVREQVTGLGSFVEAFKASSDAAELSSEIRKWILPRQAMPFVDIQ